MSLNFFRRAGSVERASDILRYKSEQFQTDIERLKAENMVLEAYLKESGAVVRMPSAWEASSAESVAVPGGSSRGSKLAVKKRREILDQVSDEWRRSSRQWAQSCKEMRSRGLEAVEESEDRVSRAAGSLGFWEARPGIERSPREFIKALRWMKKRAEQTGLRVEIHLRSLLAENSGLEKTLKKMGKLTRVLDGEDMRVEEYRYDLADKELGKAEKDLRRGKTMAGVLGQKIARLEVEIREGDGEVEAGRRAVGEEAAECSAFERLLAEKARAKEELEACLAETLSGLQRERVIYVPGVAEYYKRRSRLIDLTARVNKAKKKLKIIDDLLRATRPRK